MIEFLNDISSLVTPVAVVVGVIVYSIKGGNKASSEVLDTYRLQVEQLKDRVSTLEVLHRENLGEIGRLSGILEEKDKRIAILESVKIDNNPKMMKFMEYLTKVAAASEGYMENDAKETHQVMSILVEIKNFMGSINQHMISSNPL